MTEPDELEHGAIQTHTGTGMRRVECSLCSPVWHGPEEPAGTEDSVLEASLVAHFQAIHGVESMLCRDDGRLIG